MLVRNASPREPMCLRGPMFSLSGPCGFLFYFIFVLCVASLDIPCMVFHRMGVLCL